MVLTHPGNETVFTVLDAAARKRGTISLALQHVASVLVIIAIIALAPQLWPLACLIGAGAMYSLWGLTVHAIGESTAARPVGIGFSAAGGILAIAGVIGLALAMYTGNARGIKEPCGKYTTNKMCQAWQHPAQGSGPIIR
jgi:hypothetical protein